MPDNEQKKGISRWVLGLLPVALLVGMVVVFMRADPTAQFEAAFPPPGGCSDNCRIRTRRRLRTWMLRDSSIYSLLGEDEPAA